MLDIGPKSIAKFGDVLQNAKLVVWNGPMGVFEFPRFAEGTFAIAKLLATTGATTVIGGRASLEFLEGRVLPGIAALNDRQS